MAQIRPLDPVLLLVAAFSRYPDILDRGRADLVEAFGPVVFSSLPYEFTQTKYYEATMGADLKKHFLVFQNLVSGDSLAKIKIQTNEMEQALAGAAAYPEPRPINLDPGFLTLGKFMLATTKDQGHRIYLRDGIFAEVTLRFEGGAFHPWPWTYADYRQPSVLAFMREARELYRRRLQEVKSREAQRAGP